MPSRLRPLYGSLTWDVTNFEGELLVFDAKSHSFVWFGLSRALWTFGRCSRGRLTVPSVEGCLAWLDRSGYTGA
jgi:hypothetical protein